MRICSPGLAHYVLQTSAASLRMAHVTCASIMRQHQHLNLTSLSSTVAVAVVVAVTAIVIDIAINILIFAMMLSNDNTTPVFVPSPTLSTDTDDCPLLPTYANERRQPRIDSSPRSLASTSSSVHAQPSSAMSSFLSESKLPKKTQLPTGNPLSIALQLIRASKRGTLLNKPSSFSWCPFPITPVQFLDLRQQLKEEALLAYFEDLRWDYNPARNSFVLRLMATTFHESLQDSLFDHIKKELDKHIANATAGSNNSDAGLVRTLSKISSCGHAKVPLGYMKGVLAKKSPDSQLRFSGHPVSPFVIEIGYSQKAKSLQRLAKEYYEDSGGQVKTVLTVDVEYGSPHQRHQDRTAKLCLYRGPKRVCKDMVFLTADGDSLDSVQLQLCLSDFIPDDVLHHLPAPSQERARNATIDLSAPLLCSFLAKAHADQKVEDDYMQEWERLLRAGAPPLKRKSVHWEVDITDEEQSVAPSSRTSSADASASRSPTSRTKRQKTDIEYRPRSQALSSPTGSAGNASQRRTRSASRNTDTADSPLSRPRTRSQARSVDGPTSITHQSRNRPLVQPRSPTARTTTTESPGRPSRPRTRSITRHQYGIV